MKTRRFGFAVWLLAVVVLAGPGATAGADSIAEDFVDMSAWSPTRIAAYRNNAMPDQKPLAVLKIPSIDLVVPVYEGTSESILDHGAGRIAGTSRFGTAAGNTGIAAHRDGFFRALRHVRVGAVLQLELPETTLTYRIVSTRVVDPSETSVLGAQDEPTVTLVTCYPFYFVGSAPQRFIVRATRVATDEEVRLARARR